MKKCKIDLPKHLTLKFIIILAILTFFDWYVLKWDSVLIIIFIVAILVLSYLRLIIEKKKPKKKVTQSEKEKTVFFRWCGKWVILSGIILLALGTFGSIYHSEFPPPWAIITIIVIFLIGFSLMYYSYRLQKKFKSEKVKWLINK